MKAEILATGDELRSGALIDTNSAWIARELENLGCMITRHTCIGDDLDGLTQVFLEIAARAAIVIVTGGLGPTLDDLSRDAAARACGLELVNDPESLEKVKSFFHARGREMPPNNLRQAMFPAGAVILPNPIGTAPGFRLEINGGIFFFLPGVPAEMKMMFSEQVAPAIVRLTHACAACQTTTLTTFGLGESAVEERLAGFNFEFPDIRLGYRAAFPEVQIKLYSQTVKQTLPARETERALAWLRLKLGPKLVCERGRSLAEVVGDLLRRQKATLAVAESCTGGLLASLLTDIPGSSDYFLFGAVTYSNQAKEKILGVKPEILAGWGAVHEKTAAAMAEGVRALSDATYALATTGIAGPDGGATDKPVGSVCIALAGPRKTLAKRYIFSFNNRHMNKKIFAAQALNRLRLELNSPQPATGA
ncbi:MAG: competence/damage-inducible protein A [Deltaproteobacteria bacterium]|nr:competence/damage-inducible protein A [Deltaproteobacteria bacterium]